MAAGVPIRILLTSRRGCYHRNLALRILLLLLFCSLLPAQQTLFVLAPGVDRSVFAPALAELPSGLQLDLASNEREADLQQRMERAAAIYLYFPDRALLNEALPLFRARLQAGKPAHLSPQETFAENFPNGAARNLLAHEYWQAGGQENLNEFLIWLAHAVSPARVRAAKPATPLPASGLYADGKLWPSVAAWQKQHPEAATRPRVALTYYPNLQRLQTLQPVNAALRECTARGWACLGFFGWPLHSQISALQQWQPDLILAANLSITRREDADALSTLQAPVINLLSDPREAAEAAAANGFPASRTSSGLGNPEKSGAVQPTVWSYGPAANEVGLRQALEQARGWLQLQRKPRAQRRLAIFHFNYPPGRGNIGASFLDVAHSLRSTLQILREAGYTTSEATLQSALLDRVARNVEDWAPGEKEALARDPHTTLWPVKEYQQLYQQLDPAFRRAVEQTWGQPGAAKLMTAKNAAGELCFLLPGLQLGNVWLGPQPLRTTFRQALNESHSTATMPHHQYIAAYLWLRHVWQSDAVIHFGRHGTLEWLPGNARGLRTSDAMPQLLGGLPNVNYYIMDGGGEALQARRRGHAVLVSHLTPLLLPAGLEAKFEPLHKVAHQLEQARETNTAVADQLLPQLRREVEKLGLLSQLGLDPRQQFDAVAEARVHAFLHEMEGNAIPARLHRLRVAPEKETVRQALRAFLWLSVDLHKAELVEEHLPQWADALLEGRMPANAPAEWQVRFREALQWQQQLHASIAAEERGLLQALDGRYLSSGSMGDPLRRPASLPSGRNLHAGDSSLLPSPAGCALGEQLANQMLRRQEELRKVSIVLWHGETERNEGAMECMGLRLAGVRPKWNQRGEVSGAELIPRTELGHPRVHVLFQISGMYRDGYPDKVQWLHQALRMAAASPEPDNHLAQTERQTAQALRLQGMSDSAATQASQLHIVGNAPGRYGSSVARAVESGNGRDNARAVGELHLQEFSFAYGGEAAQGVPHGAALREQLRNTQQVLLSRSSNLYGALDLDDAYAYAGALQAAVAKLSQQAPQLTYANLRQQHSPRLLDNRLWLAQELHTRLWNPRWLKEMQASGYAGARLLSRMTEHLAGFQSTSPQDVDRSFWRRSWEVLEQDSEKLGMAKFFARENPHARQAMQARFLREVQRGSLQLSRKERRALLRGYLSSVASIGAACQAQVCGNRELRRWVSNTAQREGITEAAGFDVRMGKATGVKMGDTSEPSGKMQPTLSTKQPRLVPFREIVESASRYLRNEVDWESVFAWLTASLLLGAAMAKLRRMQPASASLSIRPEEY
jgi:cobaltochelatase CobN